MKVYPQGNYKNTEYLFRLNEVSKPFPAHRHNFLEFSYIISGKGQEIINGKEHSLKKGVFTLLLPYQVHELIPESGQTLKLYNCNLSMETFFGDNKLSEEVNEIIFEAHQYLPSYALFKNEETEKIKGIFQELIEEVNSNFQHANLMIKNKIIEIFILFDRLRRKDYKSIDKNQHLNKERKDSYLWELIFYIHNHYMEELSLSRLAKQIGVSDSHLSTSFK
ncbi:MAG: AraC family ligand binding domain-containing protein, partial [Halanaerobiaceae bacterium]